MSALRGVKTSPRVVAARRAGPRPAARGLDREWRISRSRVARPLARERRGYGRHDGRVMVASSRRHSVRVAQVYLYVGCMARCARVRGCSLCSPRRARATAVPGPRAASTRWQLYAARDATRGGRFCVLSPLAFRHSPYRIRIGIRRRRRLVNCYGVLPFLFLYLKREQKNSYTLIDKPCALPVTRPPQTNVQ